MVLPSNRLHYLYETYRMGSMRAASEHLGVAVSSISRQITQLEAELGIPLIEHGRRSVKLTEAGKLAIEYYRSTAAQHMEFVEQLRDLKGSRAGRLELAVGEGFITPALAEMVALFHGRFPAMTLAVHVAGTNRVSAMVAEDEAHIGLVFEAHGHDRLQLRATLPQPIYCVVSARHRLAARSSVSIAELAEQNLCMPTGDFRIRQLVAQAETEAGQMLSEAMVTDSIAMLKGCVATGKFAALLPALPISAELEEGRIVAIPVESQPLNATTISIVTRAGRRLPPSGLALLSMLEGGLRRWTALDAGSLGQRD